MPKFTALRRAEIKAEMTRSGVRQHEIADACGVTKAAISAWLAGHFSSVALDAAVPAYMTGVTRNQLAANRAAA